MHNFIFEEIVQELELSTTKTSYYRGDVSNSALQELYILEDFYHYPCEVYIFLKDSGSPHCVPPPNKPSSNQKSGRDHAITLK